MIYTACLWLKGKRPVPLRSKENVFDEVSENSTECISEKRRILTSIFQDYHILP